MKLFLLSIFFPLAVTVTMHARENTPSELKLLKAIKDDDPKPVEAYIHFRRDPNAVIELYQDIVTGDSLLHHAASHGSKKVVELLLKSGADPLQMNASMEYPIEMAIHDDKKGIIKLLSRTEDKRKPQEITDDLLDRLVAGTYRTGHEGDKKNPAVFVSFNGNDPSGAQMDRLRSPGKQFARFSKIPRDADEQPQKDKGESPPRLRRYSFQSNPLRMGSVLIGV